MKKIVFFILVFLSFNLLVNEDASANSVKWKGYTINPGQIGIVKFSTNVKLYKEDPNGSTSVLIGKKGQAYRVYNLETIRTYDYLKGGIGYIQELGRSYLKEDFLKESKKYYLGGGVTVQGNEIIKFEQLPQNIYEQTIELYGYPVKSLVPPESTNFGFDYIYANSRAEIMDFMGYNKESKSFTGCIGGFYAPDYTDELCGSRGAEAEIKFNETKSMFSYDLKLVDQVTKVQIQYPVKKGSIVTITRPNGAIEKQKITKFIPYEFYEPSLTSGSFLNFTNYYEYTHVIVTEKGRKFAVGRYMSVTAVSETKMN